MHSKYIQNINILLECINMYIVCLDVEGVLVPEIWINVAKKTNIQSLTKTTRDEPDYDKLMQYRLDILKENNIKLKDIQNVIETMEPFDGALDFINWIKERTELILLSDTFTQFAKPLMKKLGYPTLFCNELIIDNDDNITGYKLRQKDGKKHAVTALKNIGFNVFSAGDSYNDVNMIKSSDAAAFFKPPQTIIDEYKDIAITNNYEQLRALISKYV